MDPGACVVPGALLQRRIAHHLARGARHIDHGARAVAQVQAVQRAVHIQRARMGEGVFVQRALVVDGGIGLLSEGAGRGDGPFCVHLLQFFAGDGVDHNRSRCSARAWRGVAGGGGGHHQVHRAPAAGHGEPQVLQRARQACARQGVGGFQQAFGARRGAAQRRQVRQSLGLCELGVAHVHHHHAREEPHGEEGAQQHAQPAVDEVQPAFGVGHVWCSACVRTRCAASRPACAVHPGRPGRVSRPRRCGRWRCARGPSGWWSC